MSFNKYEVKVNYKVSVANGAISVPLPELQIQIDTQTKVHTAKDWKSDAALSALTGSMTLLIDPTSIARVVSSSVVVSEKAAHCPMLRNPLTSFIDQTLVSITSEPFKMEVSVSSLLIRGEVLNTCVLLLVNAKSTSSKLGDLKAFCIVNNEERMMNDLPCFLCFLIPKEKVFDFLMSKGFFFGVKKDDFFLGETRGIDIKDLLNTTTPVKPGNSNPAQQTKCEISFLSSFYPLRPPKVKKFPVMDLNLSSEKINSICHENENFDFFNFWISGNISMIGFPDLPKEPISRLVFSLSGIPVKIFEDFWNNLFKVPQVQQVVVDNNPPKKPKSPTRVSTVNGVKIKTDPLKKIPISETSSMKMVPSLGGFIMVFHRPYRFLFVLEGPAAELEKISQAILYSADFSGRLLFHPACISGNRIYQGGWFKKILVRKRARVVSVEDLELATSIWHASGCFPSQEDVLLIAENFGEAHPLSKTRKIAGNFKKETSAPKLQRSQDFDFQPLSSFEPFVDMEIGTQFAARMREASDLPPFFVDNGTFLPRLGKKQLGSSEFNRYFKNVTESKIKPQRRQRGHDNLWSGKD